MFAPELQGPQSAAYMGLMAVGTKLFAGPGLSTYLKIHSGSTSRNPRHVDGLEGGKVCQRLL